MSFKKNPRKNFHSPDYILFCTYLALLAMSILLVYSTSIPFSQKELGNPYALFHKHLLSIAISMGALFVGFKTNLSTFRKGNPFIAFLILLLIFLPFIPHWGVQIGGARRWISVFGLQFQPSEIVRILIIFYLAHQLSRWEPQIQAKSLNTEKSTIILYSSIVGIAILLQKDFSTTVLYFLTILGMFFLTRVPLRLLLGLIFSGILFLLPFVFFSPYRLERINMFFDLKTNPSDAYQIYQSLNAFYRGGLIGVGPGEGKHNIPYVFNDFIYAASTEELGFLGGMLILCLFFFLFRRGFSIASYYYKRDTYSFLLAFGITFSIVTQSIMNMAVNMVLIFPTGIALPFLSYGGTSLIMSSFAMGILLQLSQHKENDYRSRLSIS